MSTFVRAGCPACGSVDGSVIHPIHYGSNGVLDRLGIDPARAPRVWLVRCRECGHHYSSPRISGEDMRRYYSQLNSEYYDEARSVEDGRVREHERIRALVESLVPGGRVLEVGCGYGHLLSKFDPGRWERFGVDPSPRAAAQARAAYGLEIAEQFPKVGAYEAASFDVVLMFDVIEHLDDPAEVLGTVWDALRPGGVFVLGTGNVSSLNARFWRGRWGYYGSWEHISFYSPRSIRDFLRREGFDDVRIQRVSYSGSSGDNLRNTARNLVTHAKNIVKLMLNAAARRTVYLPGHYELAFDHMIVACTKGERVSDATCGS